MNEPQPSGKTYWKSFEELAQDPAVMEQMHHEFPADYDEPLGDGASCITRRTFVGLLGASMALAAAGCRRPEQQIVPYVKKPEYLIPGVANHFATSFSIGNFAAGLLVRSREGRPVKIEGNDLDPVSRGKSGHLAQASLLALYDPDRILRPTVNDSDSTPQNAITRMAAAIKETAAKGRQVRIVVDEHASPAFASLLAEVESALPNCRVVTWPAISAWGAAEANKALLGFDGILVPDLSKARTILGIEADFLGADPEAVYHIRNFASGRKPSREKPAMSRYYAAEATMTPSGSNADVRIRIKPAEINEFLLALLHELAIVRKRGGLDAALTAELSRHANPNFTQIAAIATDLLAAPSVVMVGRHLPVETHMLGVLVNQLVGAYGDGGPFAARHALPFSNSKKAEIEALRADLEKGNVGVLIAADVNLAHAMPAGAFKALTSKVLYRFSLSLYADETSKSAQIFIPVNHPLEAWGDARSLDGSMSVVQPLIAPMNEDQPSLGEVLLRLAQAVDASRLTVAANYYAYVRKHWESTVYPQAGGASFEAFWEQALKKGTVAMTSAPRAISFASGAALPSVRNAAKAIPAAPYVLGVLPSNTLYDGRFANLGWLQELSDPVTKVTWDNVAVMSKTTAARLGVKKEDVIEVSTSAGRITLPVFVQPGVADGAIFTGTGFGRSEGGRVLDGVGANAFLLMPSGAASIGYVACTIRKTGATHAIASTQNHHSLSGDDVFGYDRSDIVKEGTLAAFLRDPESLFKHELPVAGAPHQQDAPVSIMPAHDYSKGHRWGMSIDASACVGCNACVVACVAENNIPVVGKEQVLRGREMHWIRIDRYYTGDDDAPETLLQPMLCQHCENAPCENVCPVAATTHSPEGLNEMTYNRCVGTRYCSNNCPYKVRRFNFLNFHEEDRQPVTMVFNPDVTVRMRGVMEKCTFCVQRINEAKYAAKNEGRDAIRDGEVVTACQQSCPADAIVFGNTNDPESAVSKLRASERGYLVLRELNVRPSITYLAKIRNTGGENA